MQNMFRHLSCQHGFPFSIDYILDNSIETNYTFTCF